MTLDEILKIPLDDLSHEDRTRLLSALLDRSLGRNAALSAPLDGCAALIFSLDPVAPGKRESAFARAYQPFLATRLVVLDLEREQVDFEDVVTRTETTTTRGRWWWQKETVKYDVETVHRTHSPRIVRTSAAAWDVCQIFSGVQNVHLVSGVAGTPVPLSAYSPENAAAFEPFEVVAGTDVVINVSHRLESPASFRAVLIGRKKMERPRFGPSRDFQRGPIEPEYPEDETP